MSFAPGLLTHYISLCICVTEFFLLLCSRELQGSLIVSPLFKIHLMRQKKKAQMVSDSFPLTPEPVQAGWAFASKIYAPAEPSRVAFPLNTQRYIYLLVLRTRFSSPGNNAQKLNRTFRRPLWFRRPIPRFLSSPRTTRACLCTRAPALAQEVSDTQAGATAG